MSDRVGAPPSSPPPGVEDATPVAPVRAGPADRPRSRRRPSQVSPVQREGRAGYLFLMPWFVGMVAFTIGPILGSLYLSFTKYPLLKPPEWTGLSNFERMLQDPRLHKAMWNTAQYVFVSVPLQLVLALALAMLLNRGVRGLAFYRSVYYLPSLLAGSVSIAILWRQIFGADGLINQILGLFGVQGESWVQHPDFALGTLVVLNAWTFGAPMVIFLAGLRQIPVSLYEAADVDGATRWSKFFHITLPLLTPVIFFNLVMQMIGAFQSFTQAFVVSGGEGGPIDSTLLYTLYLYQRGFRAFDMGYASALAWVLLAVIALLTALNFLLAKRWVFYGD